MTGVLASVTSVAEAEIACAAGADIVDLKNPSAGALGALPDPTIRAIVAALGGRLPVSATIGDLPMDPQTVSAAVARIGDLGVDIVKVGLFAGGDPVAVLDALGAAASSGRRIVLVMFADQYPDLSVVDRARDLGLAGIMLDTADKQAGGLRHHQSDVRLAGFVWRAKAAHLLTGLAGSLAHADIPALLPLGADYLGFRGALCRAGRTTALDAALARAVCAAVRGPDQPRSAAASAAIAAAGAQRAAHSQASAGPEKRLAKST